MVREAFQWDGDPNNLPPNTYPPPKDGAIIKTAMVLLRVGSYQRWQAVNPKDWVFPIVGTEFASVMTDEEFRNQFERADD